MNRRSLKRPSPGRYGEQAGRGDARGSSAPWWLVRAAGAAAAAGVRVGACCGLVVHGERVAAAARGSRVRVLDLEPRLLQAVDEVDRRAAQVGRAEGVDDD